ncbi:feruloyl-CoA synthase [Paracoccus sp. M683]|uniref:feruloyl-CoA synthase n=1 Tax=Paracoccus sp. M683 TaxID=2594268 RepID=UPI00117F1C2F|nr:feruloyl-CoA synthase [Paracoccus sp. M683]TRW99215.1 feruloyl-CoA synthase [Paracoccus sp. M683]
MEHIELPPTTPENFRERAEWARERTLTHYLPHRVEREDRADGTILLRSGYPLPDHVRNTGEWLHIWAEKAPGRVAVAEREGPGWRNVTFGELLPMVRRVASGLLARGMGADDRIVIMSGNGVDHLILSLAAQYVGVPVVPLAEQYSLIPDAYPRLTYVLNKTRPRMAFVDDAARYAGALALPELAGVEIVAARPADGANGQTPMADLLAHEVHPDLDRVHAGIGPDTLAKMMFTSGSSSDPKGVLTTHRMLCVNQVQMYSVMPYLSDAPPRITDWLPWNHVFGGNHNVNMTLALGGTMHIDSGKPTGKGFATTLANRQAFPGTLAFNVPIGYVMIADALEADPALRHRLLKDIDLIFYAGASLPQDVWDRIERAMIEVRGGLPMMASSWGLTETAPSCVAVHEPIGRSGVIGVPLPGVELKLIPDDDMRCEIRVRGPNVMPGYFEDPERTAKAFDEEGFFITGDAVRFVDNDDASLGLIFDGRVSEDFKLGTGTWVQAGALRMTVLKALAGLVQDVVICGHDRGEVGLFVFPVPGTATDDNTTRGAVTDDALKARIEAALRAMNAGATGSAKRITRALILAEPPSVEGQEVTDKGSLNINKILTRRADLLERLYDNEDPALIRV